MKLSSIPLFSMHGASPSKLKVVWPHREKNRNGKCFEINLNTVYVWVRKYIYTYIHKNMWESGHICLQIFLNQSFGAKNLMQNLLLIFLMFSHESGPAKWGHCGWFLPSRKAGLPLRPGHNQTAGMIANILGTQKKRKKENRGKRTKKVRKKHEEKNRGFYGCCFGIRQGA